MPATVTATSTTTTSSIEPISTSTAPISPIANPSQYANDILEGKDRRAFEHDRHKLHKPADRSKANNNNHTTIARRVKRGNAGRNGKWFPGGSTADGNKRWFGFVKKEDLDLAEDAPAMDDSDFFEWTEDHPREVSIFDLIRPERKRNGIAQGFEIIPRTRNVVILDDDGSDTTEEEEPLDWEIVPPPNKPRRRAEKPKARMTYASVVRVHR